MNKLFALSTLALTLAAPAAFASDNYRLSCDGDSLEAPVSIKVEDGRAQANASWDGPGSAIFEANYKNLSAFELNGELTVTQPVVAGRKPGFHVTLRKTRTGKLVGTLHVDSTDGEQMSSTTASPAPAPSKHAT